MPREEATQIYGISCADMERLWVGVGVLTQKLTIWPDPRHLMAEGSKLFHIKIITESSASMGESYPRAVQVSPSKENVLGIVHRDIDGVLKREFSSQGCHVYTPHTKSAETQLMTALKNERRAYHSSNGTTLPKPIWYIQPYIPALLFLGEVRAFIVNGTIFNAIVTSPRNTSDLGGLEVQEAILFTPLSKLRYVIPPNPII
jgi:hypothetical protein